MIWALTGSWGLGKTATQWVSYLLYWGIFSAMALCCCALGRLTNGDSAIKNHTCLYGALSHARSAMLRILLTRSLPDYRFAYQIKRVTHATSVPPCYALLVSALAGSHSLSRFDCTRCG